MSPPRRGLLWLGGVALAVAGVRLLGLLPLADAGGSWCLFRRLVMPCPGCGMTRAVAALGRGDLAAAWSLHPLSLLLALEGLLLGLAMAVGPRVAARFASRATARPFWTAPRVEALALAHAGLFLALWTGRAATGTLPW
jgi:hypothetical protein